MPDVTPAASPADHVRAHAETAGEEVANAVTHAVGGVLAMAALAAMVVLAAAGGGGRRVVAAGVYGATLVVMYAASTAYHLARRPRAKRAWRVADHASIYLLIAGTYTPVTLVSLGGRWGWGLFGVEWGLAAAGVAAKLFLTGRFERASTALYVAMGWVVVVAARPLLAGLPAGGVAWLVGGGVAYTAGVAFYAWDELPFNHAVWHLFVLAGSACHVVAVLAYVLPARG